MEPSGTKRNQARNQAPLLSKTEICSFLSTVGTKRNQARNQANCYLKLMRKGSQPDSYYNTIIKVREHGTKRRSTPQSLATSPHGFRILMRGGVSHETTEKKTPKRTHMHARTHRHTHTHTHTKAIPLVPMLLFMLSAPTEWIKRINLQADQPVK